MTEPGYIAEFLKEHDRDRYLSTLILKGNQRNAVQALFAFSADVAAIPARVSEPGPGEIRLQWWRDALEGEGHGNVRQNPVAAALLDAMAEFGLAAGPLVRLIAARRFDLYQDPMPDVSTFEGYAGETVSVLYQYAATILAGGESPGGGDAAGHLGVAHALIGHLRALGFNASHGRIFLPWTIFSANGVTEQNLFAGQVTDGVVAAVSQLAEMAGEHLAMARIAIRAQPRDVRPAYAVFPIIEAELKRLSAAPVRLGPPPGSSDWRDILRVLVWSARNG